ncbi:S-layer homology domain-containing protein [Pseudomonadota bacterium]
MKKLSALIIGTLLFIPTASAQTTIPDYSATDDITSTLSDISGHTYEDAIQYLLANDIIHGYPDETFKPDQTINRAEFVKMIVNSKFDLEDYTKVENCFPDVRTDWYAEFVCFAKNRNIIEGYPDGYFKPEQQINFVEAAKIVVLTLGLENSNDTNIWYFGYVQALEDNNYIPSSIYALDKFITRGELSEILYRILEEISDKSSVSLLPDIHTGPSDWDTFTKNGFEFDHPGWVGYVRHGWDYLADELKNIEGLDTGNYMAVDHYLVTYNVGVAESASNESALDTTKWFDHPIISSSYTNVNGLPTLRREYRAYPGDVMNGRTVGFDEVIIIYTYRNGTQVKVMQYFNAHPPTQAAFIAVFESIAATVRAV